MQKILPNSNRKLQIQHWDFASAASLSRVFLENYLMFFYLCIDDVSKDEWDFRCDFLICTTMFHGLNSHVTWKQMKRKKQNY